MAPLTDYYNLRGEKVKHVEDGKGNKILVLTTSKKQPAIDAAIDKGHTISAPSNGAPSAGISKDDAKATEKFIKENDGNTAAFEGNDIAYRNSVEISVASSTRQSMVEIVNHDNGKGGTSDANNRKYGGVIKLDGTVVEAPAGPVSDPTKNKNAHIEISSFDFQSTFHSHPSGTVSPSSSPNTIGGTTISGYSIVRLLIIQEILAIAEVK